MKNRFIKNIAIILILTMTLCNLVFAENDVNVNGTDGFDDGGIGGNSYMFIDTDVSAARISLWDIEKQTIVEGNKVRDLVDYSRISRSEVESARRLSVLTKPQIIAMNYKYEKKSPIYKNIEGYLQYQVDDLPLEDTDYDTMDIGNGYFLYSESVTFPEFLVRGTHVLDTQELEKSRIKKLKEWYSKDEKVEEILNAFSVPEDVIEKYKEQKISILVEPLLYFGIKEGEYTIQKGYAVDDTEKFRFKQSAWFMTTAEIGLLAKNGFAKYNGYGQAIDCLGNKHNQRDWIVAPFNGSGFARYGYMMLPYGTYKENDNYIKAIKAYKHEGSLTPINSEAGFEQMVKQLGCFEITAATPSTISEIKIEFHPNGNQLSTEAGASANNKIDEIYTITTKADKQINLLKTYSDNFFSSVYHNEHKYTRYNTKADMSGTYYRIGEKVLFKEDCVLYVDWKEDSTPTNTELEQDGYILYEDELSYVYTFDDIGNLDTRKLTGTVNEGGNIHGTYYTCSCRRSECSTPTFGVFKIEVKHTAPYQNLHLVIFT